MADKNLNSFSLLFSHMNHDLMVFAVESLWWNKTPEKLNSQIKFNWNAFNQLWWWWWWWWNVCKPFVFYGTINRCTPNVWVVSVCIPMFDGVSGWIFNLIVSTADETWMGFYFSSKNEFSPALTITFSSLFIIIFTLLTSMYTVFCHRRSTVNFSFSLSVHNNHIFFCCCCFVFGIFWWKRITFKCMLVSAEGKKSVCCYYYCWFLFLHVESSMGLVRDCLFCIVYSNDFFSSSSSPRRRRCCWCWSPPQWDNKAGKNSFSSWVNKKLHTKKLGHYCIHLTNWKDKVFFSLLSFV